MNSEQNGRMIYHLVKGMIIASIFIVMLCASCSCKNDYNKTELLYTEKLSSKLYSESYRVRSYGVAGDVYSIYLTDSLNFREFITLYYDHETVKFNFTDNVISVLVEYESRSPKNNNVTVDTIKSFEHLYEDLIKSNQFD